MMLFNFYNNTEDYLHYTNISVICYYLIVGLLSVILYKSIIFLVIDIFMKISDKLRSKPCYNPNDIPTYTEGNPEDNEDKSNKKDNEKLKLKKEEMKFRKELYEAQRSDTNFTREQVLEDLNDYSKIINDSYNQELKKSVLEHQNKKFYSYMKTIVCALIVGIFIVIKVHNDIVPGIMDNYTRDLCDTERILERRLAASTPLMDAYNIRHEIDLIESKNVENIYSKKDIYQLKSLEKKFNKDISQVLDRTLKSNKMGAYVPKGQQNILPNKAYEELLEETSRISNNFLKEARNILDKDDVDNNNSIRGIANINNNSTTVTDEEPNIEKGTWWNTILKKSSIRN